MREPPPETSATRGRAPGGSWWSAGGESVRAFSSVGNASENDWGRAIAAARQDGGANVLDKMSVGMQQAVDGMHEGVEVPASSAIHQPPEVNYRSCFRLIISPCFVDALLVRWVPSGIVKVVGLLTAAVYRAVPTARSRNGEMVIGAIATVWLCLTQIKIWWRRGSRATCSLKSCPLSEELVRRPKTLNPKP